MELSLKRIRASAEACHHERLSALVQPNISECPECHQKSQLYPELQPSRPAGPAGAANLIPSRDLTRVTGAVTMICLRASPSGLRQHVRSQRRALVTLQCTVACEMSGGCRLTGGEPLTWRRRQKPTIRGQDLLASPRLDPNKIGRKIRHSSQSPQIWLVCPVVIQAFVPQGRVADRYGASRHFT